MKRFTALWMIVLGLIALVAGASGAWQWTRLGAGTRFYYAVSAAVGLVLVACGAWVLRRGVANRTPVWAGIAAGAILALNQGVGLWIGTIPCTSEG